MANRLWVTLDGGEEVCLTEVTAPKQVDFMREEHLLCSIFEGADIYAEYGRPSAAKVAAFENCKRLCKALNGDKLTITSKNTFQFTVMFRFVNPETGVCSLCRITKNRVTFCDDGAPRSWSAFRF